METDEQLVERALRGNEAAFGALVDRYQQRLLRFLVTRARTLADAEDALQEAFVAAWRYLHTFDPRWRFSTWLYRIALREAARIAARREQHGDFDALSPDDPLAACIAADSRSNLWQVARRELSEDAVSALWLHYVEELPQREVARALGRGLPWVKVTLMRARKRLQRELSALDAGAREKEVYG